MIVLDASAVVELLVGTRRAAAVAEALSGADLAHVPELVEPETLAALRRWLRRGWITREAADQAVRELGELALLRHPHAPLRRRVWALRDRCSAYDGCYIALAEALGAELVTADVRLSRSATDLVPVVAVG